MWVGAASLLQRPPLFANVFVSLSMIYFNPIDIFLLDFSE